MDQRRQHRRALLRLARNFRAGRITAIEAMCRVIEISPLPAEMAIEWWVELVYRTDPRNPWRPARTADALNHLVPA
ncbi:hypothetical protein [Actinomadura litoris]|uniref:hypothetical protein n=1 Tax=Actinomadura litoris TaxID=2678616 RepID=UPI001FA7F2FE|nr:hypothetical protein [Actinomadura litoris]